MIRKILKKLGFKGSDRELKEHIEKTSLENSLQPVNKNEEVIKDKQLADANNYSYSSLSETKNEEPSKVSQPAYTLENANNSKSVNLKTEYLGVDSPENKKNGFDAKKRENKDVKGRKIDVFVSSTFKDMQAERDELVKVIFPQIRKLCEQRGGTLVDVDFRWGITDEQKAKGQVLPICLAEIDLCRPFFISILGERYGWVDGSLSTDIIEQYEWLKECRDKSITELEILHGALRNPKVALHAFFYFRDPLYLDSVDENERINYIEAPNAGDIQKYGFEEAEKRADLKKKKLEDLKERIKKSGLPIRENYSNPKMLGKLVYKDLKDVIESLYPTSEKLDPLQQARFEHETFAESRFDVYIESKEYFDRLDTHVKDNSLPLVIIGDSGSGKSALLANWSKKYKNSGSNNPFLLVHYAGATPDSVEWVGMLRRIMGEIKLHFDIQQDIPDKPDELKTAFANWLHMVAAKGRMVLIIDGLNQLEDRDGALELLWLPEVISPNIRLVVSSLPGRSLDELNERGWPTLEVKPLNVQDRQKLIVDYLSSQCHKSLPTQMIAYIASHFQSSNPLYLRALLEEIRQYGDHATLPQTINHYLTTSSIDELYDKILERYEQDYNKDRENLVQDTFSYLWAARKGLSQIELLEMLASNGESLPGELLSPLYLAAEKSLVNSSGLLNFSHDYFRTAVKKRYLKAEDEEQQYYLHLADYFEKRELSKRKVDELPWHLVKAKSWNRLADLLTDTSFLNVAWNSNSFDIKGYWVLIEDNSELCMVQAYKSVIGSTSEYDSGLVYIISDLFHNAGHLSEALGLTNYLKEYSIKTGYKHGLQLSLGSQANILYSKGNLDVAMKLYKEKEKISRELGDKEGLAASLGSQALILRDLSDLDGAMKLYQEQEKICREIANKEGLAASLGNQANILSAKGDLDGAMKLYQEQERICREIGNKEGMAMSLGNQALILKTRGYLEDAMKLHKEKERICREIGNKEGLAMSLGNQALVLKAWGDLDGAMKLHKEEEYILTELGNKEGIAISLGNQALLLKAWDDLDGAMRLHKEEEDIFSELGNKEGIARSLGNQALVLRAWGDLDGAMKLHKEEERINRKGGCKEGLAASLGSQADISILWGDLNGALRLYKEAEQIYKELDSKGGLAMSLGNQGLILKTWGDLDGAMKLHKEEERICREIGNKKGLATSLGNQGLILKIWGDLDGAMKLHKEEERIYTELKSKAGLQISLGNQGLILYSKNDLDGAMKLHKEKERKCRELGNKSGLQVSLGNQAHILFDRGDLEGSMELQKEKERICRELDNKDDLQRSLGDQANILRDWGNLDSAMKLYRKQQQICTELNNKESLAISLYNQAICQMDANRPKDALMTAEQAYRIARNHGYTALANQIGLNLHYIRNKIA